MQLLVACGGSDGTLVVHANGLDTIAAVKRSITEQRPWLACDDSVVRFPSSVAP